MRCHFWFASAQPCLRLGRFGIGGWIETMSLMDHFASGLHALSASGARRSRRCIARENGGMDIACDMASWTLKRAGEDVDEMSGCFDALATEVRIDVSNT